MISEFSKVSHCLRISKKGTPHDVAWNFEPMSYQHTTFDNFSPQESKVFQCAKLTKTRNTRFMISPRTGATHMHICCQALGSGAVITFLNDLGLSLSGIRSQSGACEGNDTNRATARVLSKIKIVIYWKWSEKAQDNQSLENISL